MSLRAIPQLRAIEADERALFIGAGVTHNDVKASPAVREIFPAIADAAATIGTDQIRNVGTIGGNLCTGASCSDMARITSYNVCYTKLLRFHDRTLPRSDPSQFRCPLRRRRVITSYSIHYTKLYESTRNTIPGIRRNTSSTCGCSMTWSPTS